MTNKWVKQWKQWHTLFLGVPKSLQMVTAAMKLKRRLLLGRKVMTSLDSILKSRDITLTTKVRIVKAMVFPVVMYGCESWTIKKAECCRIDAFNCGVGEDSWESLGLQGDQTSQILKENHPEYSLEGLMVKLKLQYFGHLMQSQLWKSFPDAGEDWRWEEKMRWLAGPSDSKDMSLRRCLQEMVKDREAWHAAVHGSQRVGHNWVTEQPPLWKGRGEKSVLREDFISYNMNIFLFSFFLKSKFDCFEF